MLPPRYTHTIKVEIASHIDLKADTLELMVWKAIETTLETMRPESPLRDCKVSDVRRTGTEKIVSGPIVNNGETIHVVGPTVEAKS